VELSVLQTTLISLVGVIASLAVGFGAFSSSTEQIVVSAAGTLISLGFSLYTELRARTKLKAAIAASDTGTVLRLAKRN
jgi:hypothetical protein